MARRPVLVPLLALLLLQTAVNALCARGTAPQPCAMTCCQHGGSGSAMATAMPAAKCAAHGSCSLRSNPAHPQSAAFFAAFPEAVTGGAPALPAPAHGAASLPAIGLLLLPALTRLLDRPPRLHPC